MPMVKQEDPSTKAKLEPAEAQPGDKEAWKIGVTSTDEGDRSHPESFLLLWSHLAAILTIILIFFF